MKKIFRTLWVYGSLLLLAVLIPATARNTFAILALQNETLPKDYTYLPQAVPGIDFAIMVGSLRPALQPCQDKWYQEESTFYERAPIATLKVVGYRDWVECASVLGGEYPAVNRLDIVRQRFFSNALLEKYSLVIERQSADTRFPTYAEHMRWIHQSALFITLNVPVPQNHFVLGAGRNQEYEERLYAIDRWLNSSLALAEVQKVQHIFVFLEANVWKTSPPKKMDPFRPVRDLLLDFARKTPIRITVLYSGDNTDTLAAQPIKVSPNMETLRIPFWDSEDQWLAVDIPAHATSSPQFHQRTAP